MMPEPEDVVEHEELVETGRSSFSLPFFGRRRKPAEPEASGLLRSILLAGQYISLVALGWTAGVAMWPFTAVAGVGLYFGHRYALRQQALPKENLETPRNCRVDTVLLQATSMLRGSV